MEEAKAKLTEINLSDDPAVTLTIRLIMQGKEVGSIIGKKGEIVKRFREESGAKINISDGSCPERIVTVSGSRSAIYKAFTLITKKFEEWCSQFQDNTNAQGKTQIPIRLIVPASQCGSLIGKGGSKIKEIREITGCSIQVASEMLPNSTERAVTLSGSADAITQCIYHICCVMLESPPKGATIPYRPKPQMNGPVIVANGQAYTIQGNYAVPAQERYFAPVRTCTVFPLAIAGGLHAAGISGLADPLLKGTHLQGAIPPHHLQPIPDVGGLAKNPLAGLAALGLAGAIPTNTGGLNPTAAVDVKSPNCTALAALAGSQLRTNNNRNVQSQVQSQSHEMTVPNDLIGCIIGKGGTKIAEIRQISGAMIRISNCEERDSGNTDRTITITGNPDSVALAQYLINMSVELQKANLGDEAAGSGTTGTGSAVNPLLPTTSSGSGSGSSGSGSNSAAASAIASNPLASAIPLAQLLSKPGALNALTSLSALGGLSDLLGNLSSGASGVGLTAIQTTGVNRPKTTRMRSPNSNTSMNGDSNKKSERNKFNPY
ncbi:poly(rC)-binding protein 2 isoform X1 [Aedes aegypti]|uniref:K Homology domain-containing protein n=1 Tax=Aedes aegypti TaxID=7159 RepID=A0A6I8T4T6_AEDAE|nr:poly(rC)-binding protein 2 isoform X1 [Aedes aegypti]XP_021698524.1 poly(rC)-binding protein 2 isoform X1 [Aedes aegypti]XP_021698525.1 poly(rC)-binding protein 2 isoform X1 [Aedes aegypti]XP_021698526.1 poly(rC)-binding protein 2 isoform X1 [Aedes aegypti]XP_021698527.1 poly(rC)-binding protein 2 isoform X1 [Aedes aegypti]XP_021698528.1 poly(rC)-binding protein 2 isoform X1 [Aedes aegypti]XP_021698530.1 poly(rC)-binding protein 2 isoform X1 [Aedes aegypti]XP_021698531.1 poly(rC)-binding 